MSGIVQIQELTRVQLAAVAPAAVLVIPFGAIEQHGPHLPFGTDFFIVDSIGRGATERARTESPVVLAPTLPYGSSEHHLAVGGAMSLSTETFEGCVRDLLSSATASGFRRVFVINGHGGNEELLRVAAQVTVRGNPIAVGGGAYWKLAEDQLAGTGGSTVPGHAGRFETSLARALRADLVADAPRRRNWSAPGESRFWHEDHHAWRAIDGYTDNPSEGTAEEGAALLEAVMLGVADCLVEFDRMTCRQ